MYELKAYDEKRECYFRADLDMEGTLEEVAEQFEQTFIVNSGRLKLGGRNGNPNSVFWINLNKSAFYEVVAKQ
jgi:hypothetical protein